MATYAIGDVHGNLEALDDLLRQVEPLLVAEDTLVFLGDYLDRGPDTRGCLDRIVGIAACAPCRVESLLGNHEEWFLQTLRDPTRHSWLLGMQGWVTVASYSTEVAERLRAALTRSGIALLQDKVSLPYEQFFDLMPSSHIALLQGLKPFVRTPDVVCVHGGAESGEPVEEQDSRTLVWGPAIFPEDYEGPDILVYGHRNDAVVDNRGRSQPVVNSNGCAYGIDTIARGVLTCLRFPDLTVFQGGTAIPPARATGSGAGH